jgi:ABC-type glycerol-3-phosphate transport system permease component
VLLLPSRSGSGTFEIQQTDSPSPLTLLQTPFRTIGIREPYVRKLLFGRALWVTFLTAVIVAVLTVIFTVIPGHRL